MPGLEYRGDADGVGTTVAIDYPCEPTYFATVKSGDPVVRNGSGQIIRAGVTDKALVGVVAAPEFMRATESPKIVKVRISRMGIYEIPVAAGTPIEGNTYELTADIKLDATKTANASVKVYKIMPNGNVKVTLV